MYNALSNLILARTVGATPRSYRLLIASLVFLCYYYGTWGACHTLRLPYQGIDQGRVKPLDEKPERSDPRP